METAKKTATSEIAAWLKRGRKIDQLSAIERFGTTRLSGIIYHLKNTHGMRINSTLKAVKTRYGRTATVAEYRLQK